MRLLDLALACAAALSLASSGLGQDPGVLFEPGAGSPIGQLAPPYRSDISAAYGPGSAGFFRQPPADGGVRQVAFEPETGSPLRPTATQAGGAVDITFQPGSGSLLEQAPPQTTGDVQIRVHSPDDRAQERYAGQWQQQGVSPVTFNWRGAVDESADPGLQNPVRPAAGQDMPSLPVDAPERLTPAPRDGEVLYSREGVVYSKDGYYYLNPGSNQIPGNSSDEVRIDRNCAAYRAPNYDVTIEPLLWRLEQVRSRPLALNPVLGTTTRTGDVDLGMSIGSRVKVDYMSDESENLSGFQVVYSGVYDLSSDLTRVAPPGTFLRLPDTLGNVGETVDFSTADAMAFHYDVQFNSVEGSLIFGEQSRDFHVVVGLRYIRLEEYFRINSFTADRLSVYEVGTRDSLWGAQIGGLWHRTRGCWELTSFVKLGVYNNDARQGTFLADDDRTVVLRNFSTAATVDSFVMDIGLNAARWVNDRWLIRVGYGLLWMTNVARAPDQLDFSSNPLAGSRINFRQDAFAHGLNFGVEAIW